MIRPSPFVALALLTACGSSDGGAGVAQASFEVTVLTTSAELGEVKAFNAQGLAVTVVGGERKLTIIDVKARTFVTVSQGGNFIGFDDDGDLLYSRENGTRVLRHGDGHSEDLPIRIESNGEFTPFALAPGGVVWGYTFEKHEGELATPGYAMLKEGVISGFRAWGDRAPEFGTQYVVEGANGSGQVVFCKVQAGTQIAGNGLPKEECFIANPDGSSTDLNPIYKDAFRAVPLPINERGQLAGSVDYGDLGLGGSRVFLYDPPTGYLLGEESGAALVLNDAGDVIYTQKSSELSVLLRKANGQKSDLGSYIRNPVYTHQELNGQDILAMNTPGWILIRQSLDGFDTVQNVALLTPK